MPGRLEPVSFHDTKRAAQIRVAQMRKTKKWATVPLGLTAAEAPDNPDGYGGVVYAYWTGVADDGEFPEPVVTLDLTVLSKEEFAEIFRGWSREKIVVPRQLAEISYRKNEEY